MGAPAWSNEEKEAFAEIYAETLDHVHAVQMVRPKTVKSTDSARRYGYILRKDEVVRQYMRKAFATKIDTLKVDNYNQTQRLLDLYEESRYAGNYPAAARALAIIEEMKARELPKISEVSIVEKQVETDELTKEFIKHLSNVSTVESTNNE